VLVEGFIAGREIRAACIAGRLTVVPKIEYHHTMATLFCSFSPLSVMPAHAVCKDLLAASQLVQKFVEAGHRAHSNKWSCMRAEEANQHFSKTVWAKMVTDVVSDF